MPTDLTLFLAIHINIPVPAVKMTMNLAATTCISFLFFSACFTPYQLPQAKSDWETIIIKDMPDFKAVSGTGGKTYVGNNVQVIGCEKYLGGIELFLTDLRKTIKDGLSCLSVLGTERKKDAAQLAALFDERIEQRKVSLYCGEAGEETGQDGFIKNEISDNHAGLSFSPDSMDFPGFHINVGSLSLFSSYKERRGLLLHEMLHWLGYKHSLTLDLPYIAEACCFSRNPEQACQLLRESPDFQSPSYLERFALVGKQLGISEKIAVRAGMEAAISKKDGLLLFATIKPLFGKDFQPFLGYLYSRSALHGLGKNLSDYSNLNYDRHQQFANEMGLLLGKIIRNEKEGTHAQWAAIKEMAITTCPLFDPSERKQFSEFIDMTTYYVFKAEAVPWRQYSDWVNLCKQA